MEPLSIFQRLCPPDLSADFRTIIRCFDEGITPIQYCGLEKHFAIAREKGREFRDHEHVLSISFGGSNAKAMLCRTEGGTFRVEAVSAMRNPPEMRRFHDFLDQLLIADPVIREYIVGSETVCVGFSIPMTIKKGVPFHATKLETLSELVARSPKELETMPTLEENVGAYLAKHNPKARLIFLCQSDGIVAHLGAVALAALRPQDKSELIVCGTGFATGDEINYIMPISINVLDDEELYPRAETEGGQFQYCVAGKGIYAVLRRAIGVRAAQRDAAAGLQEAQKYFQHAKSSKYVYDLWSVGRCGARPNDEIAAVRREMGEEVFRELVSLATPIGDRAVYNLAASTVATMLFMGNPAGDGKFYHFFEGGIATNPYVLPKMKEIIADMVEDRAFYRGLGKEPPQMPVMDTELRRVEAGDGRLPAGDLREVDLSLVGACTMAIAEAILRP